MNPIYDFEDLDDYLNGRMSDADRDSFEQAVSTDPQLAEDLAAMRAEKVLRRLIREDQFLEQFDKWEPERKAQPAYRTRLIWASLLIFLLLGVVLIVQWPSKPPLQRPQELPAQPPAPDTIHAPLEEPVNSTPQNEAYANLAKQFFHPSNMDGTLMGEDSQKVKSIYYEAQAAFKKQSYQYALKLLIKPDSNFLHESVYLRAYTRYHLGQYRSAEQDFREFRNFAISDFKYDAQWGEVFCLLRQLPNSTAHHRLDTLLKTVVNNTDHPYFEEAQQLIQQLNKR